MIAAHRDILASEVVTSHGHQYGAPFRISQPTRSKSTDWCSLPPLGSLWSLCHSFCDAAEEAYLSAGRSNITIMAGDVNLPFVVTCTPSSLALCQLLGTTKFLQMKQINYISNARDVVLDLVFSPMHNIRVMSCEDPLLYQDAHPVVFELS